MNRAKLLQNVPDNNIDSIIGSAGHQNPYTILIAVLNEEEADADIASDEDVEAYHGSDLLQSGSQM